MSVETFEPGQAVSITEAARTHLREQVRKSGRHALRLGLKESGCNGYMYTLDYLDNPATDDLQFELEDGVLVYVARADLPLLRGTEVDYVREGLNASLKFKNPNAESHCGCGESFSLAGAG